MRHIQKPYHCHKTCFNRCRSSLPGGSRGIRDNAGPWASNPFSLCICISRQYLQTRGFGYHFQSQPQCHSRSRNHPPTQQLTHSRSQSHSKTPTAHQRISWQSALSTSVPASLRRTNKSLQNREKTTNEIDDQRCQTHIKDTIPWRKSNMNNKQTYN